MPKVPPQPPTLHALSLSQTNIWHLEQAYKGTSINNICATISLKGILDIPLIQESLNLILGADQNLRTRIKLVDGLPYQYHAEEAPQQFPVFDFSLTNKSGVEHWEAAVTREVMPLYDSPLYSFAIFKLGEGEGGILVKTHHIISDGWSQVLFCNRIAETYFELLAGRRPQLKPVPSYQLHVDKERDYLNSPAYERDRAYWAEKMAGFLEPSSIKECASAAVSPVGQRSTYRLSQTLNHAIQSFCEQRRVAPFAVFYMALAIYLQRIRATEKLAVGVPVFNRVNMTDKETTGMFVSTLPFLNEIDDSWSFDEFNERLAEQWYELLRYQKLPFTEIAELAKERQPRAARLFHLVLSYQTSKIYKCREADLVFSGRWNYSGYQNEHLLIHLSSMEDTASYSVDYDYLTQIFSPEEIHRLHHYLVNILTEALAYPERPIWQLAVIGEEEKERVLFGFNQTGSLLYDKTIQDCFCRTAEDYENRAALIYAGKRLTYGALKTGALLWAEALDQALGAADSEGSGPAGDQRPVALLLPKTPDLIMAMTAVMLTGRPWLILPADTPRGRLAEILEDSGAALLLTSQALAGAFQLDSQALPWLDTAGLPREGAPSYQPKTGELAYLGYTSGSTGKPKGAEIYQKSLLNFAMGMAPLFCHRHGAVLSLCSTGFDVFVLESMAALFTGQTIVLPEDGEQEDPARLAALIRGYAVGFLAATPSRVEAFLKNPAFQGAVRRLESLVLGGEHCSGRLLKELKRLTRARIYNQYGPTETTIGVSWKLLNNADIITIGHPMPNCRLYVLDKRQKPLPVGVYGDLYIGGLCVGRGYRGRPELTGQCFFPSPFEPGERIYRSGDVGCWTESGEILLGGREDQQIKLRGLRIEPSEIAARLALHPEIHQVAVKVLAREGKSLLAAYYTAERTLPETELYHFALAYLPNYMLPGYLCRIAEMPLTQNGKIDLSRLPEPLSDAKGATGGGSAVGAPASACQSGLLAIFRQALKRQDLDEDSDYFLYGGDSLNAMEVLVEVEARFGASLRVADLYACRTARRLAETLEGKSGGGEEASLQTGGAVKNGIVPAPLLDDYPLTHTQLSLYFESQLDPAGLAYNIPGAFRLPGGVDPQRLESAFRRLIAAEPLLRTAIVFTPQGLRQKIAERVEFSLPYLDSASFEEAEAAFIKPFDLSAPPLLRAALWREPSGGTILFIDMHHIISDGISTPVYLDRLDRFYRGESLKAPELRYMDYAYWLDRQPEKREALDYWRRRLLPAAEGLELPPEGRPKAFDYQGARYAFGLDEPTSRACQEYCDRRGLTPYMFFMAVYGLLLAKASGSGDFIVGTPVSGRTRRELMDMPGAFMHPLPFRLTPARELSLAQWLEQVKADVLDMINYQGCSIADLTAMVAEAGGGSGQAEANQPLYRVMFHYRPLSPSSFTLEGKPLEFLPLEARRAKLDLNLEAGKEDGRFCFWLEYALSLFDEPTIALYSRSFKTLAAEILRDDSQKIGQVSAASPEDRLLLIEKPNRVRMPYEDRCLDQLFDDMAQILPDHAAIRWRGEALSYRELRLRSDALAAHLLDCGARPGDIIALTHKRTPDIITALLGILKAGCAYMPLLTSFPANRLSYMLENGGIALLLCDGATRRELPNALPSRLVAMPDFGDMEATRKLAASFVPPAGRSLDDKMHVLYTSGTTGQPKGAVLNHRPLTNLLYCMVKYLEPAGPNALCCSNVIFDTFITETLLSLALGKTVILADEEEMLLPWKMGQLIEKHQIGFLQLTPSRLQVSLGNDAFAESLRHIKIMLICGEAFPPQLLANARKLTKARILNACGPTECAVYVVMEDITDYPGRLPIGKLFPNCRAYVLDEDLRPVMPTAKGEMYLGGECLGAGYLNHPDLTEKAYINNPFVPGEKLYRTGDMVRVLPNGSYDHLGRRDAQIKLNGQRVELDEITGQMLALPWVKEAAAVAVKRQDGVMSLRGFVAAAAGAQPDQEALKKHLRENLPPYMVPSVFIFLDQLPKTATGKTDKRRLTEWPLEEVSGAPWSERSLEAQPQAGDPAAPAAERAAAPIPPAETAPTPVEKAAAQASMSAPVPAPAPTAAAIPTPAPIPAPDLSAQPLSAAELRSLLTGIWETVLEKKDLRPDISFFEQGGSSMTALTVLSQYFNRRLTMTLADFYAKPTLDQQVQFLAEAAAPIKPRVSETAVSRKASPAAPSLSAPQGTAAAPSPASRRGVLLTGATGFLGAHLLKALIEAGRQEIYCLVRGGDRERLAENLNWFFGRGWTASHLSLIQVWAGDIGCENLGFDPETLALAKARVGTVLHAAADVRHYADEAESLAVNSRGAASVIAFTRSINARLAHISTISVAGEFLVAQPERKATFSEADRDIGQNWQDNVYVKGKFLGEAQVFKAMEEGLEARIFRVGRLVGRQSDGVFQKAPEKNSFYAFIQGARHLDALPEDLADFPVELTAVDLCAAAIVALLEGQGRVYHLLNPQAPTFYELMAAIKGPLPLVDRQTFETGLIQKLVTVPMAEMSMFLDVWNRNKQHPFNITPTAEKTCLELEEKGFFWPKPPIRLLLCAFPVR